jgi:hypothetical protein
MLLRAWANGDDTTFTVRAIHSDTGSLGNLVFVSRSVDETCEHVRGWLEAIRNDGAHDI